MFDCPINLLYSGQHVWVLIKHEQREATVGVTEDLMEELGEILSIDVPLVDDELEIDHECIHLHLPNHVFGIGAPLTGRATEINRDVLDDPSLLHLRPYEHWVYRMEFDEAEEVEMLMDSEQYTRFLDQI